MHKVVMGLSGGLDSSTLLGLLLEQGFEIHCCSFIYGSKHGVYELEAAEKIVAFYQERKKPVIHRIIDLRIPFLYMESSLLKTGGPIPEGHYEAESMRLTVVPGRNLIFASVMAGIAESIGAEKIALGVHSGDHAIYPDCRPKFIKHLNDTILASTDNKVEVIAPLLYETKASILYKGWYGCMPKVPYELTRTCYKEQEIACGRCGSCSERILSFHSNGLKDPIEYEGGWNEVLQNAINLKNTK